MVEVLAAGMQVLGSYEQQVGTHAEVGECQIAHEEFGDAHSAAKKHQDDCQVPSDSRHDHEPNGYPENFRAHHVLARVEGVRHRKTLHSSAC